MREEPSTVRVTAAMAGSDIELQVGDVLVLEVSDAPGASISPMGGEPGPVTHPLRRHPDGGFVAVAPGRARVTAGAGFDIEVVVRPKPGRARPLGARD